MTDLYHTLGISRQATAREIKSAYRKLARECHPDVSASPDANLRFATLSEAYQVLIDESRRAAYDRGEDVFRQRTFYAAAAYAAAVVAQERVFNLQVDEELDAFRQEMAERRDAVLVVVPLFISAFYVMAAKPQILEGVSGLGKMAVVALAGLGLFYLINNLKVVLQRYTYHAPESFTSVFQEEKPKDKPISRRAGLIFLICGYFVSLGMGYVVSKILPLLLGAELSLSTLLGCFLYPPIAVLLMGSLRKLGGLLFDRI
jgi:hypothetical protein